MDLFKVSANAVQLVFSIALEVQIRAKERESSDEQESAREILQKTRDRETCGAQ